MFDFAKQSIRAIAVTFGISCELVIIVAFRSAKVRRSNAIFAEQKRTMLNTTRSGVQRCISTECLVVQVGEFHLP